MKPPQFLMSNPPDRQPSFDTSPRPNPSRHGGSFYNTEQRPEQYQYQYQPHTADLKRDIAVENKMQSGRDEGLEKDGAQPHTPQTGRAKLATPSDKTGSRVATKVVSPSTEIAPKSWQAAFVASDVPASAVNAYNWQVKNATRVHNIIRVDTSEGAYALKRTHIDVGRARFLKQLLNHVEREGFNRFAHFALTKSKQPFIVINGQCYYATRWVEGTPIYFTSLLHVKQTAYALAQFYEASRGFETAGYRPQMVYDLAELTRERWADLTKLTEQVERKSNKDGFDELFLSESGRWIEDAHESLQIMNGRDVKQHLQSEEQHPGLCHLDVIPGNFVYGEDKEVYILDFDLSTYAPRALDIAHLLRRALQLQNWTSELAYNCFLQYNALCDISKAEYRLIQGLMTFPYRAWRIAHTRYRVFVDDSQFEDLSSCVRQEGRRQEFLQAFADQLAVQR